MISDETISYMSMKKKALTNYSMSNKYQYTSWWMVSTLFSLLLILSTCTSVESSEGILNGSIGKNDTDWLIPTSEVYAGATKDQIASIDEPQFVSKDDIDFMRPDDLVLAVKFGNEIRAYPHKVLNYHEIVNDEINGIPLGITFCPLTGSGISWDRRIGQITSTFGVSGKIYKNNLIAYDRETDSYWSQMLVQSVFGPFKEYRPSEVYHNLVEMSWEAWIRAYPDAKILRGKTILAHAYDDYPYGEDYKSDNKNILFPIGNEDDRLERKTLCHGINYSGKLVVFPIEYFDEDNRVINYDHSAGEVVVVGDASKQMVVSFQRSFNGEVLSFSPTDKEFPDIMMDNLGNTWDVFGVATAGPDLGEALKPVRAFNAYWFAWADFYPEVKIYSP